MTSSPRPRGEIKRVPVPVRHSTPAPDPISTATTSPPVIPQATLSSSLPSTQTPLIVHGQYRPRGPIPIVATNSHQPLPAHFTHGHNHSSQPPYPYTLHTIEMYPEPQNRHSTLPAQVEEDIKAAVLASMPPNDLPVPMKRRKTVVHRKNMRWTSLSLLIILVVGEIPVSALFNIDLPALFSFTLGTLLCLWNGWRLFRLRQKFDNEKISGWHVGLEALAVSALIAVTITVVAWTVNQLQEGELFYDENICRRFWRGTAVAIILFICFILHFSLLIIMAIEKWTKPAYLHTALASESQPQQPPQIIVQYTATCPICHGHGPRLGEDENSYLARVGDSQPQGVAPVTLGQHKEAAYTDESLNEHDYYGAGGIART